MQRPSTRNPWWLWLLAVIGGLGVLVPALALVAGGWLVALSWPQQTNGGVCTQRFGVECDQLTPAAIGELAAMSLPPETAVESSSYEQFQDWRVKAVVIVPADRVSAWETSLTRYPAPTNKGCAELEGRGTDRRCAAVSDSADLPVRRYTRATQADGSVVVFVEAFSL